MKAVTFQALHQPLTLETLPDPVPGAGEVVVRVALCGICGSDLHMTEDAAYGCQAGDVLGHEFAGEVVELGREVEGLKTGDLVSVIPLKSCGQCEACRKGTVQWTDELQKAPPITLTDVDVLIQNPGRHHRFRIDATPTPEWGDRFSIHGDLRHALWETQQGDWKRWSGTVHAQFGRADVAELRKYTQLGVSIQRGKGALRLWADVRKGEVSALTADVSLQDVNITLSPGLPALELDTLSGRLGGTHDDEAFEFHTQALQFTTHDGVKWPGGNVFASQKRSR